MLTPLKARIFDAIARAGPDGISSDAIINELRLPVTSSTLRAHVWQINEALRPAGKRIVGHAYRVVSTEKAAAPRLGGGQGGR